jgi:hypothetical protein
VRYQNHPLAQASNSPVTLPRARMVVRRRCSVSRDASFGSISPGPTPTTRCYGNSMKALTMTGKGRSRIR